MSHAAEFDEYGHKDHGHVIVSLFTLRFVLAALLICTLATSGAAWAENSIAEMFHVEIPQWINAAVALSIAVLKTVLVVTFFMQLKYDNPMNTIIFVFTILTVFSFLGFTSLDLNNRDTIDRFKNQYAYDGGDLTMGGNVHSTREVPGETAEQRKEREARFHADNPGESIVDRAKRVARERQADLESEVRTKEQELSKLRAGGSPDAIARALKEIEEAKELMHTQGYDPHHEHHADEGLSITEMGYLPPKRETEEHVRLSTTNASRPVAGVTIPGLLGYRDPKQHHHVVKPGEGEHAPAGEHKEGEQADHKAEAPAKGDKGEEKAKGEEKTEPKGEPAKPH